MQILFDRHLPTTPEYLLPIIERLAKDLMDRNDFFLGEIEVRPISRVRHVDIDIGNGLKATVSRPEESSCPENVGVIFFDTMIGIFDVIQTSRYPSVSHIVSKLLVSPESFEDPDGLGGYENSIYVMNYLIEGVCGEVGENISSVNRPIASRSKYGPHGSTECSLKELRKYRRDYKRQNGVFPTIQASCSCANIDRKTVKTWALELLNNWEDPNYDMNN